MSPVITHRRGLRDFMVAVACLLALIAPARAGQDATPQAFLTALYHRYEVKCFCGIKYWKTQTMRRYFEPSLVALIDADLTAAAKHNEIPELDGDPFVDAQEWQITELAITTEMHGADNATGTVTFRNFGEPKKLTVQLVRMKAGWRIADILSPDGSLRGIFTNQR